MRRAQLLLALISVPFLLPGQQPAAPPYGDPGGELDQPGQPVARLGVINGDVSVQRGDSGGWIAAVHNAPLMAGDSISVPPGGSAELQLDNANFVRIGGDTEVRISEMGQGRNQIQLSRGLITYRTLRGTNIQSEISTPAVAVHPYGMAAVRVEIAPDGSSRITVRHGEADASTPQGTERIREGNMMMVRGSVDNPEFQIAYAPPLDGWDGFNEQRDGYLQRAQSNRYVSPDVYGVEDLDSNGRWSNDPAYGDVWTPNVPADWAPYRNGQWVWEDFYGWTWVDADPWGWAPFHYGSWYQRAGYGWTWFPGHRNEHFWWHPAMVGFFGFGGGGGISVGFGNIGWIPLAPYERFHPWYGPRGWGRDRYGVNNVNVIYNTNITNVYRNAAFGGGTAVSSADFQRGVFRNRMAVGRDQLTRVSMVRGSVPMAPTANNLRFSDRAGSGFGPRGGAENQRFFSRTSPGAAPSFQRTPFARQQEAVRGSFGGNSQFPVGREQPSGGGSGWQRFGEPNQGANRFVSPGPAQGGNANRGGGSDWGRFGNPRGTNPPGEVPRQNAAPPQQQQRFQQQPQFERQGTAPQQGQDYGRGRSNGPGYGGGGYDRQPSRSLQVAPPIVRQREQAPSYGGGGGNRGGGGPSYRSAPAPRGGNGGGHENGNHGNHR